MACQRSSCKEWSHVAHGSYALSYSVEQNLRHDHFLLRLARQGYGGLATTSPLLVIAIEKLLAAIEPHQIPVFRRQSTNSAYQAYLFDE